MAITLANDTAIDMCDARVDKLDQGAGAGKVKIYTGTKPTNADAAISDTLLVTFTAADPAFGNAADTNPDARATANSLPITGSPAASGNAGWYLATDSDDNPLWAGSVTTSGGGGDMEINSVVIAVGTDVDITSWFATQPEN